MIFWNTLHLIGSCAFHIFTKKFESCNTDQFVNENHLSLLCVASLLFWIDSGFFSGVVNRAAMDGTQAKSLFGTGFLSGPNSIAIDYTSKKMFLSEFTIWIRWTQFEIQSKQDLF